MKPKRHNKDIQNDKASPESNYTQEDDLAAMVQATLRKVKKDAEAGDPHAKELPRLLHRVRRS